MSRVLIFGDSYFDLEFQSNKPNWSWLINLENYANKNNFEFINHSRSGMGSHYFFKNYYEYDLNENDICIFHLTDPYRIDFPSIDENQRHLLTNIGWNIISSKSYCSDERIQNYYETFQSEIDFFYICNANELEKSIDKNISYLYCESRIKKCKVIIFCYYDDLHEYSSLNDERFFLSDVNLFRTSALEIKNEQLNDVVNKLKKDRRVNHFSEENHEIMFEYVRSIMKNSPDVSRPQFKSNFRNAQDVYEVISDNHPGKFLYE